MSQRPLFGMRIRLWVAAALPALLAVLMLLMGFLDRYQSELSAALRDRARAGAAQLAGAAAFPLFVGDLNALQRLADATLAGDPQVRGVGLLGPDGQFLVRAGQLSPLASPPGPPAQWQQGQLWVVVTPVQRLQPAGEDLFDLGYTPLAPPDPSVGGPGHVVLELTLDVLAQRQRELLWWAVAIAALGLALAGVLSTAIASSVTRPIDHISRVVARIGDGHLDTRADEAASGALAVLAGGINAMAGQIAMTQAHLQAQVQAATEELQQQKDAAERAARVDSLTGVANRRAYSEAAEIELQRALRYRQPLAMLMVDIDHFKVVNDTHGHLAGDAALVSFARTLVQEVREVDMVGRWGGEEFAVLLPNSTAEDARRVAERMRQAVAASEMQLNGQVLRCTASFGVAELGANDITLGGLQKRADDALYRAKRLGRNRVEVG